MSVTSRSQQMRVRIAQEAARLMAEEGVQDFYAAKRKAAQHLGAPDTHHMPGNQEVEQALMDYQRLFLNKQQSSHLAELRQSAVQAMTFLKLFDPRLVGSVLSGTAGEYANINLHLFADASEEVGVFLMESNIPFETSHKRLRVGNDEWKEFPTYLFLAGEHTIELVVFPRGGHRDIPRSPVDGKPMNRANVRSVEALLLAREG